MRVSESLKATSGLEVAAVRQNGPGSCGRGGLVPAVVHAVLGLGCPGRAHLLFPHLLRPRACELGSWEGFLEEETMELSCKGGKEFRKIEKSGRAE